MKKMKELLLFMTSSQLFTSDTVSVSTSAAGIENLNNSNGGITIFPNPAKDKVFLSFPETTHSKVTFKLYSANGILVMSRLLSISGTKSNIPFDVLKLDEGL